MKKMNKVTKIYPVNIYCSSITVAIEARNEQEAINKAKIMYYDGELPLEMEKAITTAFNHKQKATLRILP